MSEQKTKVSDLPQNEQDALINEAKELNVRGLYTAMNVDTLQRKIADAKAEKNGEQNGENEQEPATDEQNAENNEQEPVNDEQENVTNEPAAVEPEKKETAPKIEKGEQRAYAKEKDAQPAKVRICHICRSKVVNGKCTGCGFELKI